MAHLWCSSDASFLKGQYAWERRSQGAELGPSRCELRAMGGQKGERGSGVQTDRAVYLQTEVQLSRRPTVCFARPLFCSFLHVQTKKIFVIDFRMLSHRLNVKQSNQTFQSPFPLPTLCMFCHRPMYMSWGDNSWGGAGQHWYLQRSITSKTYYFTIRGNS